MIDLNKLAKEVHQANIEKGFYEGVEINESSQKKNIVLIVSELAEAVEADRKENRAHVELFNEIEEKLKKMNSWEDGFKYYIKDSFEDEIADTFIRILDMAGWRNVELRTQDNHLELGRDTIALIHTLIQILFNSWNLREKLNASLSVLFEIAELNDFDLMWHVENKIKYNKTRPYKHGKKY